MEIDVFTLFPEWFDWFRTQRHFRNVEATGSSLNCINPRDFTTLSGRQVDDTPFGGGAGMVLRVDVMDAALRGFYGVDPVELRQQRRVIALTPGGRMLDDRYVDELAAEPAITLLCGRYEGFDERIVEHLATDAISIGPYVLAGGELGAMVVMDTVLRKVPGALGHQDSAVEESFSVALEGGPEYPHYTRPAVWRGHAVPDILLSGDHAKIRAWRIEQSRQRAAAGSAPGRLDASG
jgi:tRNA (guanine37-N1)-methyltransferase